MLNDNPPYAEIPLAPLPDDGRGLPQTAHPRSGLVQLQPHPHRPPLHDAPPTSLDTRSPDARTSLLVAELPSAPSALNKTTKPTNKRKREPSSKTADKANYFMYWAVHFVSQMPKVNRSSIMQVAGYVWALLPANVKERWKEHLNDACKRCRLETGLGIVGRMSEYMVEGFEPADVAPALLLEEARRELEAPAKKRKTESGSTTATRRRQGSSEARSAGKAAPVRQVRRGRRPSPATSTSSRSSHSSYPDTPAQSSIISFFPSANGFFDIEALEKFLATFPAPHDAMQDDVDFFDEFFADSIYDPAAGHVAQHLPVQEVAYTVPVYASQEVAYGAEAGPSWGWPASQSAAIAATAAAAATATTEAYNIDDVLFDYIVGGGHVFGNPGFSFVFDFSSAGLPYYPGDFVQGGQPFAQFGACDYPSSSFPTDASHSGGFERGSQPFVPSGAHAYPSSSSSGATVDNTSYWSPQSLVGRSSVPAYVYDASGDDHLYFRGHVGPQGISTATSYIQDMAGVPVIGNLVPYDDTFAFYSSAQQTGWSH